jgi:hypothetical protein
VWRISPPLLLDRPVKTAVASAPGAHPLKTLGPSVGSSEP